jgi:hypothetical protein
MIYDFGHSDLHPPFVVVLMVMVIVIAVFIKANKDE